MPFLKGVGLGVRQPALGYAEVKRRNLRCALGKQKLPKCFFYPGAVFFAFRRTGYPFGMSKKL